MRWLTAANADSRTVAALGASAPVMRRGRAAARGTARHPVGADAIREVLATVATSTPRTRVQGKAWLTSSHALTVSRGEEWRDRRASPRSCCPPPSACTPVRRSLPRRRRGRGRRSCPGRARMARLGRRVRPHHSLRVILRLGARDDQVLTGRLETLWFRPTAHRPRAVGRFPRAPRPARALPAYPRARKPPRPLRRLPRERPHADRPPDPHWMFAISTPSARTPSARSRRSPPTPISSAACGESWRRRPRGSGLRRRPARARGLSRGDDAPVADGPAHRP